MNNESHISKDILLALVFFFNLIRFPLIIPNKKFKIFWDLLMMFMILVHFYVCLLELCFQYSKFDANNEDYLEFFYFYWIEFLIVMTFIDIILKFNSGYFINGSKIMDRKTIIQFYLKNEFFYDFLAILGLSLENLCMFYNSSSLLVIKIIFYSKYPILKKLIKKLEVIINFDEKILALISLFKLFAKMSFLSHVMACLWLIIPNFNPNQNWMLAKDLMTKSFLEKYEFSLYWACVTITTIGYGDIVPQNSDEVIFTLIVIMLGSIFFGYSLTSIATIFNELDQEKLGKKYFNISFLHFKAIKYLEKICKTLIDI